MGSTNHWLPTKRTDGLSNFVPVGVSFLHSPSHAIPQIVQRRWSHPLQHPEGPHECTIIGDSNAPDVDWYAIFDPATTSFQNRLIKFGETNFDFQTLQEYTPDAIFFAPGPNFTSNARFGCCLVITCSGVCMRSSNDRWVLFPHEISVTHPF